MVNADDENALKSVEGIDREIITFGIVSPAKVQARNLEMTARGTSFDLYFDGEFQIKICLSVLGKHNVYNALSACAAALKLGVSPTCIAEGLSTFHGAGRRFEFKGEFNGAQIYDDYAHHPSEVRATLESAKTLGYERVICVFQPHTYTRTAALKEEFASALSLRMPHMAGVLPIYAAREKNTIGIESDAIADLMLNSHCFSGFEPALEWIRKEAKAGDLILTMGAGDIVLLGEKLIEEA